MKKLAVFLLLISFSLVLASPSAAYYQVKIDSSKTIHLLQGQVLGEQDNQETPEKPETPEQHKSEDNKQPETKPQENRQPENKPSEDRGQQNQERQQEVQKKQAELRREATKELGKIQKKLEILNKNSRVILDPAASDITIQNQITGNEEQIKELNKKRSELEGELLQKAKELNKTRRQLIQEQLNQTKEKIQKLQSTEVDKTEDQNAEVSTPDNLNLKMDNEGTKHVDIEKEGAAVRTQLPVGVDVNTSNLVIKTPNQEIETPHTPDKVLETLKQNKVVDELSKNQAGSPESTLVMQGQNPVYEIKGVKKARFLGVIPVDINKDVQVSAQNGNVLNTTQDFVSRFLELFSF